MAHFMLHTFDKNGKMLRRLFNTVIENAIISQQEATVYPSPFASRDIQHLGWLPSFAPCFPINANKITILHEPQQFYNTIINLCKNAKRRITLVSLYIGTGKLEKHLVDTVLNNEHFANGTLNVNVLLDYTRGSRYEFNSRKLIRPLLQNNESTCWVSLYHTPLLRGIKKKLAPERFNELFGLQHMKVYIFDDKLVISGANLSNDYFTNRQDRYFLIEDKSLCDFYCDLVKRVQSFSLRLDKNDNLSLNDGWKQLPYEGDKNRFVDEAGELIGNYILDCKYERNIHRQAGADTWVFPLVQMGQLGIKQDAFVTRKLLADAPKGSNFFIATGYFNLTHQYMKTILQYSQANCNLLMAHPDANGFQGAKGPAGGIPAAYSLIAYRFKKKLEKMGLGNRITMNEYLRDGWTYHAKGLWYYAPGSTLPCLTLIGSPNFGERSVKRDLETQLAIVTENDDLRLRLHNECRLLYKLGKPAETDREIPKWIYPMVFFFRGFF